jgi:glycosyltransferase involved in cell wall biosynthesis
LKVSIITITRNSELTLKDTIDSVVNQTYQNIEYIFIDSKSTDNTLPIIQSFGKKISILVSEKDDGLYDALNKGIALATGDIIGILHSDDFYVNNKVIENVVNTLTNKNADALYADMYYVEKNNTNKIHRKWKSGNYTDGMFLNGWMPPHPTFFVKREVYKQFGSFNLNLTSAADYELMLRFIHKQKIKLAYLPEFIIKMRLGGKSNISLKNRMIANKEDRLAWKINNLKPNFFTLYIKPLRKIIQLFVK